MYNNVKGPILYTFLECYFKRLTNEDIIEAIKTNKSQNQNQTKNNIFVVLVPKTISVYFYTSSLRSSAKNRSILACLINIHEPVFWLACCVLSDARLGQPQVTRVM